jgi:peptidoglycan/LPS O-acetylase OafA/YrhL
MWVILGHTYLNSLGGIVNTLQVKDIFSHPFLLLIMAGLLAVDVFFYLGGFFMAFVFMREKSKSWLKYPVAILHRVIRIWPAYVLTMLFYYTTFMKLGSGPKWSSS